MGSVGLWVGLGPGSKFSLWYGLGWVGLGWSFSGLGWVEQIGPTDNSGPKCTNFGLELET